MSFGIQAHSVSCQQGSYLDIPQTAQTQRARTHRLVPDPISCFYSFNRQGIEYPKACSLSVGFSAVGIYWRGWHFKKTVVCRMSWNETRLVAGRLMQEAVGKSGAMLVAWARVMAVAIGRCGGCMEHVLELESVVLVMDWMWGLEAAFFQGESQVSGSRTSISLVPYTEMMEPDTGDRSGVEGQEFSLGDY